MPITMSPVSLHIGALRHAVLLLVLASGLPGCSLDNLAGNAQLPPGVPDPRLTHTPAGALAAYRGALVLLRTAVGSNYGGGESFVPVTGLLTDELRAGDIGQIGAMSDNLRLDSRFLPEYAPGSGDDRATLGPIQSVYGLLQQVRGQAREARGALGAYDPGGPRALPGHLYAVEGYADILLADLFCSGIPLSTLDFGKDFTYQPGSSTAEVYQRAVGFFDSALTVVADSDRILNLARVGKGRALLALGQYAAAGTAVAQVPDAFQYALQYSATSTDTLNASQNQSFAASAFGGLGNNPLTMVDVEGGNGLAYLSSGDPRSAWVAEGTNQHGFLLSRPVEYSVAGDGPIVLASGVEARLIQAEAALQAGSPGTWLATLNHLRETAITPAMADTTDPGTTNGRVGLMFYERGFWLFLTGHRQGDLRRLIRQYGRQAESVYPTGLYPGAYGSYGSDVTAPIPGAERVSNPLFTGCRSRGA
jgi:hypothetical protein